MAFGPNTTEKERAALKTLDAETLRKIEAALTDWESVDASVRAPVDALLKNAGVTAEGIIESIGASERLSEEDLAIRINTRE